MGEHEFWDLSHRNFRVAPEVGAGQRTSSEDPNRGSIQKAVKAMVVF